MLLMYLVVDCLDYLVSDFTSSGLAIFTPIKPEYYATFGKIGTTLGVMIGNDVSTKPNMHIAHLCSVNAESLILA